MTVLSPLILGRGSSGQAIARSLALLKSVNPELKIADPVWAQRGAKLAPFVKSAENPVLFVANPHGLHSKAILEAEEAGFKAIVCEKPSCTDLEQLESLRQIKTPVAILHVYRMMWGPQELKRLLDSKSLGDLISVEGKYWSSSTAEKTLNPPASLSWKSDSSLSGDYDTYLDLGSHWIDLAAYFWGTCPQRIAGWRSYANADSSHRDSHVQVGIDFPHEGRAFASFSKTVHGATNHLEVNLIGTKRSASWSFLNPDEIVIGEGCDRRILSRKSGDTKTCLPPHHGKGWLEGYMETIHQVLGEIFLNTPAHYPKLTQNLELMKAMLNAKW